MALLLKSSLFAPQPHNASAITSTTPTLLPIAPRVMPRLVLPRLTPYKSVEGALGEREPHASSTHVHQRTTVVRWIVSATLRSMRVATLAANLGRQSNY